MGRYAGVLALLISCVCYGQQAKPAVSFCPLNLPGMRERTDAIAGFSVVPNLTAGLRVMYRF